MRPTGSPETLEARRKIAARLFERGMTLTEVAAAVGSSTSSAHRWHNAWKHGGKLRAKVHPGPHARLTRKQLKELVDSLYEGTHKWGYFPSGWTGPLVRDLIRRKFGIDFHPKYIPRLLRRIGWSAQKPERRARERNEQEIARWHRDEWSRIKKEPRSAS